MRGFQAEDKLCKDFLNTIPLISLLGNKAMRPRHWIMLMKATGKSCSKFVTSDANAHSTARQLDCSVVRVLHFFGWALQLKLDNGQR